VVWGSGWGRGFERFGRAGPLKTIIYIPKPMADDNRTSISRLTLTVLVDVKTVPLAGCRVINARIAVWIREDPVLCPRLLTIIVLYESLVHYESSTNVHMFQPGASRRWVQTRRNRVGGAVWEGLAAGWTSHTLLSVIS